MPRQATRAPWFLQGKLVANAARWVSDESNRKNETK